MEQPLESFRSSTWGWLRGTLAGWCVILLGVVGIGAALANVEGFGLYPLALTALSLVIVLVKWVQNWMATYEITGDRLIIGRGIFIKSLDEVELYRVKDIRLDFSLINQWAGIGTITLLSSDETTRDKPLVIPHIENARSRRETLRGLVDTARQRRRVREIDMHEDA
jgi:uncharacterized membrane protein YdbT with pleckstrin-like domain